MNSTIDVAIVGAGPAGLSAAIECRRRGLSHIVLDKGTLVDSIRRFPVHMVFFTTPELLEIGDMPLVTPHEKPTRLEALKYYRRVAEHFDLELHLYEKVDDVRRENGSFQLSTTPRLGGPRTYEASNVVVATGYYDNPNMLNVPGEDLPKVSHYYHEAHVYFGLEVAIVGGANSAAETALELFRSGVKVTLIHREKELSTHIKYWVRPDIVNRVSSGRRSKRFSKRKWKRFFPTSSDSRKRAESASRFPTTSCWPSRATNRTTLSSSPWRSKSNPRTVSPHTIPRRWKPTFPASMWRVESPRDDRRTKSSSRTAASTASKSSNISRRRVRESWRRHCQMTFTTPSMTKCFVAFPATCAEWYWHTGSKTVTHRPSSSSYYAKWKHPFESD